MVTYVKRFAPFLLGAALLAGCGGGGGGGGTQAGGNRPNGGGGVNGISLGNCLIDENWLVQPSQDSVDGQTPDGSNVHITLYASPAEATKSATGKKGAVPIESAVVTFTANPTPYAPGESLPKANQRAVDTVGTCVKSLQG